MADLDIFDILNGMSEPEPELEPEPAAEQPPSTYSWTTGDFPFEEPVAPDPIVECSANTVPLNAWHLEEYAFLDPEEVRQATNRLAKRLLENGPHSFLDISSFEGNGVYALYYHGGYPIYEPLRSPGSTCPLYIGKSGQRDSRNALAMRLRDHAQSIQDTTLGIENFTFRLVCLPLSLVEFAESNLIASYQPLWNTCLQGFGKRRGTGQSSDRPEQYVSRWDTLHSGRATMSERTREITEVEAEVRVATPGILDAYHEMMKRITSSV